MAEWTKHDINVLKSNLNITNKQLMDILPNKSINNIKYKCKVLGLRKKTKFCRFGHNEILRIQEDDEINERITGHLLGDGSLNSSISFSIRNIQKEYIVELQSFFNSMTGRNNKIITIPSYVTTINNTLTKCKESYVCTFTCAEIFRPLKKQWYYGGKKIVPKNINLTPIICNRWYCDDGNLYIQKTKGIARITIYTDSFNTTDVDFLIYLLSKCAHVSATKKRRKQRKTDQYVIIISGENVIKFLEYIGPPPVLSFEYKWNLKTYMKYSIKCSNCGTMFKYGGFKNYRVLCNKCSKK